MADDLTMGRIAFGPTTVSTNIDTPFRPVVMPGDADALRAEIARLRECIAQAQAALFHQMSAPKAIVDAAAALAKSGVPIPIPR